MADNNISGAREKIWTAVFDTSDEDKISLADSLAEKLNIRPITAKLLVNRGFSNADDAKEFLDVSQSVWHSPFLLKDIREGVARILKAVENKEKIVIYGDYDVDGVTSVSSLYTYLTKIGGDVSCYIPSRLGEGYGMSRGAVGQLAEAGTQLIITVDTGITASEEIEFAKSLGVDTVVTDHHECHGELPCCCAVINPHRPDCSYPFCELAGVGVIFKVICAVEITRLGLDENVIPPAAQELLDFVAIGTVADVMPLVGENRYIVSHGLRSFETNARPGLAALSDAVSGMGKVKSAATGNEASRPHRRINTGHIGYGIAPRINAAGRIAHAMRAVELMLAKTPQEAESLAEELCEINTQRQAEENTIAEKAYAMIEDEILSLMKKTGEKKPPRVIVLEDNGWAQGIIGIVSSRITERYGVPSILISFDGAYDGEPDPQDIGKGSGRSVKGMNLVDALGFCEDLLVRFGGHELAAGLSVRRCDIPAFRERICEYAEQHLTEEMTVMRLEAECEVSADELTMELSDEISSLEPFGVSNPTPNFILSDATVHRIIPMGAGKHTKLMLMCGDDILTAVWFGMPSSKLNFKVGDSIDVFFHLNVNEYQGTRSLQLILSDARLSLAYMNEVAAANKRYADIVDGASIPEGSAIVPTRDDIARVYKLLRQDVRMGQNAFSHKELLSRVNTSDHTDDKKIGHVKMRFILSILEELKICRVEEVDSGIYLIDIDFNIPKTNIEASTLLQRLRKQSAQAAT